MCAVQKLGADTNKVFDIHKEIKERLRGPEPIITSVDATPNEDYPIRILEAFLQRTGMKWGVSACNDRIKQVYAAMNVAQDKRKLLLENAICILKQNKVAEGVGDIPE